MVTTITGLVLEFHRKKSKDGSKEYKTLLMYEKGKLYPALIKVQVNDDHAAAASLLTGECVVEAEIYEFDGKTNLSFKSGKVVRASP